MNRTASSRASILGLSAVLALAALPPAPAQDEQPAVQTSPEPSRNRRPISAGREGYGTTILGERETPIGLYITPWRDSPPEEALDRPAKLLEEAMLPLDPKVFARYIEYSTALEEHRKATQAAGVP